MVWEISIRCLKNKGVRYKSSKGKFYNNFIPCKPDRQLYLNERTAAGRYHGAFNMIPIKLRIEILRLLNGKQHKKERFPAEVAHRCESWLPSRDLSLAKKLSKTEVGKDQKSD